MHVTPEEREGGESPSPAPAKPTELVRCNDCKAIHTKELAAKGCRKCSGRVFWKTNYADDDEIPVLERMGFDWEAEGWVHREDPDDAIRREVQEQKA